MALGATAGGAAATDSADGRYRAAIAGTPASLVIEDRATGAPLRTHPLVGRGGATAVCASVFDAAARRSFVIVLDGLAEAWEISYADNPEPVYEGLVHDYRAREGLADPRPFALRRIPLDTPITGAWLDRPAKHLFGIRGGRHVDVINLDVRRRVDSFELDASTPVPTRCAEPGTP